MKIIGTIERSKTGYYSIYPDKDILNCAPFGYGETLQEAKEDFMLGIEELRQIKFEELGYYPKEFDDLVVEFRYDLSTLFEAFDFLNVSKFAQYAGINESKMRQYASGVCDPGVKASRKISDALKTIGQTLLEAAITTETSSADPKPSQAFASSSRRQSAAGRSLPEGHPTPVAVRQPPRSAPAAAQPAS
jgi:hypothetical protein